MVHLFHLTCEGASQPDSRPKIRSMSISAISQQDDVLPPRPRSQTNRPRSSSANTGLEDFFEPRNQRLERASDEVDEGQSLDGLHLLLPDFVHVCLLGLRRRTLQHLLLCCSAKVTTRSSVKCYWWKRISIGKETVKLSHATCLGWLGWGVYMCVCMNRQRKRLDPSQNLKLG